MPLVRSLRHYYIYFIFQVWRSFLRQRGINATDVSQKQYYELWEELVHDPTAFAQEMKKAKRDNY